MNRTVWRVAITVLVALYLGATGWIFSAVADLPKNYIRKPEFQKQVDRDREDHDRIETKIDLILEQMLRERNEQN